MRCARWSASRRSSRRPARLDAIGAATRRLEQELDPGGASPFSAALKSAQGAVSELQREVEAGYLVDLT